MMPIDAWRHIPIRTLSVLSLLLVATMAQALSYTHRLPESELQARLDGMMPIERKKLFLLVRLSDAVLDLMDGPEQIGLSARIDVELAGGISESGWVSLAGNLRYEPEGGAFYLDGLTVREVRVARISESAREKIVRFVERAARQVLAVEPIYELDEGDLKQRLAKATLTSVAVSDEHLVLEFEL